MRLFVKKDQLWAQDEDGEMKIVRIDQCRNGEVETSLFPESASGRVTLRTKGSSPVSMTTVSADGTIEKLNLPESDESRFIFS